VEIRRYYHVHRPTQVKEILKSYSVEPKIAIGKNIKSLLLKGFDLKAEDDFLDSRKALLVKDCTIGLAAPQKSLRDYFYKNADADEMIFIHKGREIRTMMGNIPFEYGIYYPRGYLSN
jgi:homogentisate 1,2-dioxygenase